MFKEVNKEDFRKEFTKRLELEITRYKETHKRTDAYICEKYLGGISRTTLNSWLDSNGCNYPSFQNLIRLADFLKVSTDYLTLQTDEPSIKYQKEKQTIKTMCEKTGLDESTILTLCDNSLLTVRIKKFLNYMCDLDTKSQRILKKLLLCDDENEQERLEYNLLEIQANNEKQDNIYHHKKMFLAYLDAFLFHKIDTITAHNDNEQGIKADRLYLYNDAHKPFNVEAFTIDKKEFEKFYLDTSNKYLERIKDYYIKNDYDKLKTMNEEKERTVKEIDTTFYKARHTDK